MCLSVKNPTVQVAKKGILCYKHGTTTLFSVKSPYNYYRYFYWFKNKKVELEKFPPDRAPYGFNVGYHSFNDKESAKKDKISFKDTVGVFVIPKGAEYVDGEFNFSNARISSRIIYCGRNNMVNRFLAKLLFCN